MRFMLRWIANAISFYLALYLVDSLMAPRFIVEAVWVAIILAVFLGLLNSLIRPLHMAKKKPVYAAIVTVVTVLVNTLVLQVFVWAGAPLSATQFVWVLVAAAFLSLLGGVLNWLIGFKVKDTPSAMARERRAARLQDGRDQKSSDAKRARARD